METISQLSPKGSNLTIGLWQVTCQGKKQTVLPHIHRDGRSSVVDGSYPWGITLGQSWMGGAVDIQIRLSPHYMIFRRTGIKHPKASSSKDYTDWSSPVLQACVLWSLIAQWVIPAYRPLLEGKWTVWSLDRGTSSQNTMVIPLIAPVGRSGRGKSVKISPSQSSFAHLEKNTIWVILTSLVDNCCGSFPFCCIISLEIKFGITQ